MRVSSSRYALPIIGADSPSLHIDQVYILLLFDFSKISRRVRFTLTRRLFFFDVVSFQSAVMKTSSLFRRGTEPAS